MNVKDRVVSAKHTLTGSGLGKAVGKATSHEVIGPKKKHVDYILTALETDNVSIPDTADMLFERCNNSSWIVVFKSLVTFHHIMSNGNERFVQYIASRSTTWMLQNFLDKNGVQGYDMSHIIRKYAAYLMEKAYSYRTMGYDFCKIARGKEGGILRNMDTSKLLKALPAIQTQLDSLVATEVSSNDLTNGVVTAGFMLLFRDLIRLFACYNDGIINLLEKYFEMKKADCKASLDLYKKFLARMDKVSEFLRAAEDAGIDKGDIPDLSKAPNSLLEALDTHYQSLEKGKGMPPPSKPVTIPAFNVEQWYMKNEKWMENGVTSASTPPAATAAAATTIPATTTPTTENPDDFLQQQQRLFNMFQKNNDEEQLKQFHQQQPPPQQQQQPPPPQQQHTERIPDLFNQPSQQPSLISHSPTSAVMSGTIEATNASHHRPSNDLLFLAADSNKTLFNTSPSFGNQMSAFDSPANDTNLFGYESAPANKPVDFTNPFLTTTASSHSSSTPNLLDDILTPESPGSIASASNDGHSHDGRLTGDLNKGLERVALSLEGLNINPGSFKVNTQRGHQWNASHQGSVKTGGANFQMSGVAKSTMPPTAFNTMAQPRFPQYGIPVQPYYAQQPAMYPMMPVQQPPMYGNFGYNQRLTTSNPINNNDPFK